MDLWLSILTGLMVAAGSYLMMSGTMLRFLLGLVLVSNAVNLMIFIAGRMTFAGAPFITKSSHDLCRCSVYHQVTGCFDTRQRQSRPASADLNRDRDRLWLVCFCLVASASCLY